MITLIIFLCLLLVLFITLSLIKVPIAFNLKIENDDLFFSYKAFFKEREIKNNLFEFIKSGSAEFDKKILLDVSEVIDVKEFKTNLILGTPFVHLTNFGVLFFSWLIPTIYRLPFREKRGLYFKVIPKYDIWSFQLFITGKIRVSVISVLVIIFKIKRRLSNKKDSMIDV